MIAALTVLALWCVPSALIALWIFADEFLAAREDRKRRAEQDRQVSAEWLAVLAATEPTPVFDQMCFERWEAEL